MAGLGYTGDETPADRRHPLLLDHSGNLLVPTSFPPTTDFDDYRTPDTPAEYVGLEEQREDGASYFDTPDQVGVLSNERIQKSQTDDPDLRVPRAPKMQRAGTAPVGNGLNRPVLNPRQTTLIDSLKKVGSLGGDLDTEHGSLSHQYSYRFDPMSSDSDSSSSEDEAPRVRSRTLSSQSEAVPTQEERQAKKDAKKGRSFSRFVVGNEHFKTKGRVSRRDGRLKISVNETANSGYLAKALGQSIRNHLDLPSKHKGQSPKSRDSARDEADADADAESLAESLRTTVKRPRLNIVIMVIGSRGDIQPFLKVGMILQHKYGHRVRIATHPAFREFVEEKSRLEFFSVGGNPSELMAFMVKNPGLIPNMQTVREGEISRRRSQMAEMFDGFWRACVNATDDESDSLNLKLMGERFPFVADAIIANPPSFAHVHIAERLGIPLHMMFTFPYSPTQQFPHPLANIKPSKSNVDANYVNFMSYPLVEMMTWSGLGDLVNRFRVKTLGLEPVSSLWAPGALYRMKVPYTYMWSPSLCAKPKDWGPEIDIAGFTFLDLGSNFEPPAALTKFLDAGEPPIYIGFGSIVVDDAKAFTDMIFKAVALAGVRALVNEGWGGIGKDEEVPDNIFLLGNTPHDWLFPKVRAVVHHGGAGTTAIGLKCGKPTMIVPFFGDQPFWGAMVANAKAGAHECVPYKKITAERLATGIKQCLEPEAQANVQRIADSIAGEGDGAENAVKSFHRSLPLAGRQNMRCSILEDRVAVWKIRSSSLRLSALAAGILVEQGKIKYADLHLLHHCQWNDFDGPGEPITGGAGALAKSLYGVGEGVGMVPIRIAKHVQRREEAERRKREIRRRKEERRARKERQAAERAAADQQIANDAKASERPQAPRAETGITLGSTISNVPSEHLLRNVAGDVGHGLKRSGKALVMMPNELHVAIAQGFHNAPRLWGDATVRKPVRITDIRSGCTAARKEFAYGIYDGVTGLVMHPIDGWKDGESVPAKFQGFGTGIGKGIGGLVLKNISAIVAPPAFVAKGFIKHIEKERGGPGANSFIRRAHIVQGQKDLQAMKRDGKEDEQDDERRRQLRDTLRRVEKGWEIYEEIWDAEHRYRDASGHGPFKQWRLDRERKRWAANGALENVETASRALRAVQRDESLERLFGRRKQEMLMAEQPRAAAMAQPQEYDEAKHVLPNGQEAPVAAQMAQEGAAGEEEGRDDAARLQDRAAPPAAPPPSSPSPPPAQKESHAHALDDSSDTVVGSDDDAGRMPMSTSMKAQSPLAGTLRKAAIMGDMDANNNRATDVA